MSIPPPGCTAWNALVNYPGSVPYQELEPGGAFTEIHQQVLCLLHDPSPVRARGDAAHETRHASPTRLDGVRRSQGSKSRPCAAAGQTGEFLLA